MKQVDSLNDVRVFTLSVLLSGSSGGSENVHRPGATVGEQMRIGYREGENDIPMDHREKSEHHAIRRES